VHYVTDDGMLISDQTDIQFSPEVLSNPVSKLCYDKLTGIRLNMVGI
jgi:hypothetical protein